MFSFFKRPQIVLYYIRFRLHETWRQPYFFPPPTPCSLWDLSSSTRDWICPQAEYRVLTTGQTGNSPTLLLKKKKKDFIIEQHPDSRSSCRRDHVMTVLCCGYLWAQQASMASLPSLWSGDGSGGQGLLKGPSYHLGLEAGWSSLWCPAHPVWAAYGASWCLRRS